MTPDTPFQLIQIVFWLALSTWFGAVMFIAVSAPVIFRTVRENNPVLTNVLSVNLEGQHATLLAGSIVGNLLARLAKLQLACGGVVLVMSILHLFFADMTGRNRWVTIFRIVACVAAAGVVAYDRYVIWPRIVKSRDEYVDHADEPEVANPAKDRFDADHRQSMTLILVTIGLLLLLIMYSANVQPAPAAGTSTVAAGGT
ncbi:MAG TPA: DUF4149 domain-containing protein [Tepidisphaeraceae bacterium]|jgi:hypothetical protein